MSPGVSKTAGNASPNKLRPYRGGPPSASAMRAPPAKGSPRTIRELNEQLDALSPPLTPMSMAPLTVSVRSPMSVVPQSPAPAAAAGGVPSKPPHVRIRRRENRMRAPSGLSDSDSGSEDDGDITLDPHGSFLSQPPDAPAATSAAMPKIPGSSTASTSNDGLRKSELPSGLSSVAPAVTDDAEVLLREWEHRRQEIVRESLKQQLDELNAQFAELRASSSADLAAQQAAAARHAQAVQQALEHDRRKHEAELARLLQSVQSEHAAQTQEGEQQLRKYQEEQERLRLERLRKKEQEEKERRQREEAARLQREHDERVRAAQEKLAADLKAAEEKKAREAAAAAQTPAPAPSAPASGATSVGGGSIEADAAARVAAYNAIASRAGALGGGDKAKRDALTSRVRMAVNQVSNDWQQVKNCVAKVTTALQEAASAAAIEALLYDVAGYVLEQTDCQISKHQDSAYGYASFCLVLSVAHPAFMDTLLGCLNKECVYTVPRYVSKLAGQSDHDALRAQGYRPTGDDPNQLETEDEYTVRMQGALALYAAMLQTNAERGGGRAGADMAQAWRWLARMGNLKPRRITAAMLFTFLELAGFRLNQVYGRQFAKYVRFVRADLLGRLPPTTPHAARGRLEMWTETYEKANGRLLEPEGRVF